MITLNNYQITTQLHQSSNSSVYRAYRKADKHPLIIKMLKKTHPSPSRIARFTHEYQVTANLNLNSTVKAYSLETDHHRWFMTLEDFGGQSLDQLDMAGKLNLTDFLELAINISQVLGQLHQKHIIHKDINPANIIYNPDTKDLKLIDFGISTILSREATTFRNPNVLEGTLAYISPEQTGRMNRAIDYRTDFYSLGITLYNLLTGHKPFESDNALEMIHCHLAKQAIPPHEIVNVPPIISNIILKLMAKNAGERYQSAYGLIADLKNCLQQLQNNGYITPFPLAQQDLSDRFQIPQQMYGREEELKTLLTSFEQVTRGESHLMLVSGYSGIGKTALVQEIYKPITQQQGYFLAGKFDQYQRNIPYAAPIQAFQTLIKQLLTEDENSLALWRKKLLAALGENGQVIIDVIPNLALIIGPQPPVLDLDPGAAQLRFNYIFQNFIRVFAQAEHPLVIFLDDLQWADEASLKLLEVLITDTQTQYLYLIGAYRDNEVKVGHPLLLTLADIEKAGQSFKQIVLPPLNIQHTTHLIADTLHQPAPKTEDLANLVYSKTGGNPFFLTEFLKSLYIEKLLNFNLNKGYWEWDLSQIETRDMTANVITLMTAKVKLLNKPTQEVLKQAACIGNYFDLETLAIITQKSINQTAQLLWPAIEAGLVLPLSEGYKLLELEVEGLSTELKGAYKFAHDRIQQATYSLIPENKRQQLHYQIGHLLLKNIPPQARADHIFDLVNHLNQSRTLIKNQAEREQLAELNALAGKKANDAMAAQSAVDYLTIGRELLDENAWESHPHLMFNLHWWQGEAEFLVGHTKQADELLDLALTHAPSSLEKVDVYISKLKLLQSLGNPVEAVAIGTKAFNETFKLNIPNPDQLDLIAERTEIETKYYQAYIQKHGIESLADLPPMTDETMKRCLALMDLFTMAVLFVSPEMKMLMANLGTNLLIKYGLTKEAPYIFTEQALASYTLKNYEESYKLVELALKLLEAKDSHIPSEGNAYAWLTQLITLKQSFEVGMKYARISQRRFLEEGNPNLSASMPSAPTRFSLETSVQQSLAYAEEGAALCKQLKQDFMYQFYLISIALGKCLQGQTIAKGQLDYSDLTLNEYYKTLKDVPLFISNAKKYELKALLTFDMFAEALPLALEQPQWMPFMGSFDILFMVSTTLDAGVTLMAMYEQASTEEQTRYMTLINEFLSTLKPLAEMNPMNFGHHYLILEAEKARIEARNLEAMHLYKQAIDLAQTHKRWANLALANELAAKFYFAQNLERVAVDYLKEAHYAYRQWGASAKVKDLEEKYPQLTANLSYISSSSASMLVTSSTTVTSTGSEGTSNLDLHSLMKAVQAISGEIRLSSLLEKMITIIIENAGAQRAVLIMEDNGQWLIKAKASIEADTAHALIDDNINIMAENISNIALSLSIVNYVIKTKETVVLNNAPHTGLFTQDPYILHHQPQSVLCTPLINRGKLIAIIYLENRLVRNAFTPARLQILNLLSGQAAISIENANLYTHQVALTEAYSRFVPPEYLNFLQKKSITQVNLGDHISREMTIMFSDIRSFTTLSEQMTPQENFDFVNSYLKRIGPLIRNHNGFVVKYMGDGVMSLFPNSADDAVKASIAKLKQIQQYNIYRQERGYRPIKIGIGIHVGHIMVGIVGEEERMQGDAISDTVNVSSRLEGLSKHYGVSLIVSQKVIDRLPNPSEYHLRLLGKAQVKGRQEPLTIFEVFDGDPSDLIAKKLESKTAFEGALIKYYNRQFTEAKSLLAQVLQINPQDKAAKYYQEQADYFAEHGVATNWMGVDVRHEK